MQKSLKILMITLLIIAMQGAFVFAVQPDEYPEADIVTTNVEYEEAYILTADDEYDADVPLEIQPRLLPDDDMDYDYYYGPIYWDMGENPDGEDIMPIMADLGDEVEELDEEFAEIEAISENVTEENNRNFLFGLIAIIAIALIVTCIRVIKKSKKLETN